MFYNCILLIIRILFAFKMNVCAGLYFFFSLQSDRHDCTNWIVIIVEIIQLALFRLLFVSLLRGGVE
jgi:hypothetical protein